MPRDQRAYWKEQDGGMHVLAAATYVQFLRAEEERGAPVVLPAFFATQVGSGHLTGEELVRTIDAFFAGSSRP